MRKLLFFLLFLLFFNISWCQSTKSPVPQKQTLKTSPVKKNNFPSVSGISKKPTAKNPVKNSSKTSLNGQWRGFFDSKGDIVATGGDNTEYVLELDIQGTKVNGYSYSYFQNRSYYVICSLGGEFDKATKSLTVTETARIKGVTPAGWNDCLQTHTLVYKKEGTTEELTGKWKMAPGQLGDCGFGITTLTRKTLTKNLASYNQSKNNTVFSAPRTAKKKPTSTELNKPKQPLATLTPKAKAPLVELQPQPSPEVKDIPNDDQPVPEKQTDIPASTDINFEKRNNDLLQTVKIENETIRVDLYDNGVIDGDSISLFYNSKLILSHQRLSEKAITLTLNVNTSRPINELTMYAENLGEIPPNTALMVVTDGDNRYEVPITSDLKSSGTIRFVYSGKK